MNTLYMKTKVSLLFAFFLIFISQHIVAQGIKVIKPTEYIKIEVPEDYYVLSEDEKLLTFPSIRMPISAVTNLNKSAMLGINKSNNLWSENDLDILKLFYKSNIQALHDEVSFLKEEIKEINGRKFIIFEFTSVTKNDGNVFKESKAIKKYNYIQYAIVKNDIIIFNFYTSLNLMNQLRDEVTNMMGSIILKKVKD